MILPFELFPAYKFFEGNISNYQLFNDEYNSYENCRKILISFFE
ncbi:YxiJ family protein [Hazenella coriacea]